MTRIETSQTVRFLSTLYASDVADAWLLAEYPSSNSTETRFTNPDRYIIHDPFPPPRRELIKILGPHHLMCCWGRDIVVTSEIEPPAILMEHWRRLWGDDGCPDWRPFESSESLPVKFITLFPHQSISAERQWIDPDINYELHSKEVIEKIDCPQADVLSSIEFPCIVKLSHGYAGLGNFFLRSQQDEQAMRRQLAQHWPQAVLVANSIIENIRGDYGVQFYLRRDGSIVWLGFTEQMFNENLRWCGGRFQGDLQTELFEDFCQIVEPVGAYLHQQGYFGLVGIDILRDASGRCFLVDVNPRLTGITPFLMASLLFAREGLAEGIYQASLRYAGSLAQLIAQAESVADARVVILSGFEEPAQRDQVTTICHVSVTSATQQRNQEILTQLFGIANQ